MSMDSIIQWNINGLQKYYTGIHRAKFSIQPTAFYFQGTNLQPNATFFMPGYISYLKNRQTNLRANRRGAIFVNNLINSNEIIIQSPLEVTAVTQLYILKIRFVFVTSIYLTALIYHSMISTILYNNYQNLLYFFVILTAKIKSGDIITLIPEVKRLKNF